MSNARRQLIAIIFVITAATVTTATGSGAANASDDRTGNGPYAVGTQSLTFVDTSRPTPPNGTFAGAPSRTLPTLVLYPAEGNPNQPPVQGAQAVHGRHRFPLIVFSHGFTANGPVYAPLLALIARRGYVVAAPTFPLSSGGAPGGPTIVDYVNQPRDVSFLITRLLDLDRNDAAFRREINPKRIGVAGHSLGAITTLGVATNSAVEDRRIDAAVSFSGIELPFGAGSFFSKPTPPLLLVHGDADRTVPYGASVNVYGHAPPPKAFLTLINAPHTPFLGPWLDPTIRTVVDFLDGYLKHDHEALERLTRDGNVPGASSLQQDLRCPKCHDKAA
jgi:pimeloyl-ACP methyl ester carboxylesterase